MAAIEGLIALKADTAQVRKATTDLKAFNANAVKSSLSAKNLGKNVIDARGAFKAMRGSTSQLSYQLQDVAVQAQMGTSAFTILAQQGPQIASIFGPGGAVIGALIAVSAALAGVAYNLRNTGMSSEELEERISALDKEFNLLTATQKDFMRGRIELKIAEQKEVLEDLNDALESHRKGTEYLARSQNYSQFQVEERTKAEKELLIQIGFTEEKIRELEESINGESKSTRELIQALELEKEVMGKSNRDRDIAIAKRNKASDQQIEDINRIYDEIEAIEARIQAEEEAEQRREILRQQRIEREAAAERALQNMFNQMADEKTQKQIEAQKEEERIARLGTQRMLEASEMLFEGKSDNAQKAANLAINLADAEKRQNATQIISDSYAAAMKAYKAMSGIPVIGPALGAAAAGAIIAAGVSFSAKSLTGRALGGQVRPGESYVVGERGPEVLTMGNAGGRIATNESMKGGTSLVYSPTVNISGGATEQDRALFTAQLRQQKAEIADLLARRRF